MYATGLERERGDVGSHQPPRLPDNAFLGYIELYIEERRAHKTRSMPVITYLFQAILVPRFSDTLHHVYTFERHMTHNSSVRTPILKNCPRSCHPSVWECIAELG